MSWLVPGRKDWFSRPAEDFWSWADGTYPQFTKDEFQIFFSQRKDIGFVELKIGYPGLNKDNCSIHQKNGKLYLEIVREKKKPNKFYTIENVAIQPDDEIDAVCKDGILTITIKSPDRNSEYNEIKIRDG